MYKFYEIQIPHKKKTVTMLEENVKSSTNLKINLKWEYMWN